MWVCMIPSVAFMIVKSVLSPRKSRAFLIDWSARRFVWDYSHLLSARQVAKLGEIKLKQIQQLNTADSSLVVRKHKEVLNLMMRTLQLDTYGLTWVQFSKGVGVGGLLVWLLMRWIQWLIPCDQYALRDVGQPFQSAWKGYYWPSATSFSNQQLTQPVCDHCRLSKRFSLCVFYRSLKTFRCTGRNPGSEKLDSFIKPCTSFGWLL